MEQEVKLLNYFKDFLNEGEFVLSSSLVNVLDDSLSSLLGENVTKMFLFLSLVIVGIRRDTH